jgi:hypothetical protein
VIRPGRQLGEGKITVSDLQGHEWYAGTYQGEESVVVSLKAPAGLYIVTLTGAEYRMIGRVVME